MSLTKIVCTLGPATESPETIRAMIRAGMTVARLNFSHGTHEDKRTMAKMVREVAAEEGRYVAVMGDLQGPKIRVGGLPEEGVRLVEGKEVVLTAGEVTDPEREIPFPHPEIIPDLHLEDRILMDDGNLELEVIGLAPPRVLTRVQAGGVLTSHKGVNLPGADLQISALTDKDREDARLIVELKLDFIALSFVRRSQDIVQLREYLTTLAEDDREREPGENPHHLPDIVSKIEKPEALLDLENIVRESDVVMVARGDLGVETAPEEVPLVQKELIGLCNRMGKPVITATQMLQSMIDYPRPTRAEASDVANAILDGSDAVMLSGETAIGKYPVAAVQMMRKIAEKVEASDTFPYHQLMGIVDDESDLPAPRLISRAISRATVEIAQETDATAILSSTESGRTARMVARHRPCVPLIAATPFEETARRMQVVWGVISVLVEPFYNTDQMLRTMAQSAVAQGFAEVGSNIIVTVGIPFEVHGVTNMLKVHTVREADLVPE